MIASETVNGRPALVAYYKDDFDPVDDRKYATGAKVIFTDDGEPRQLILTIADDKPAKDCKITGDGAQYFVIAMDRAVGPFTTQELADRAAALLNDPAPPGIAFDKSARVKTVDGYLIREGCFISKACVSPYKGSEIPDYDKLGLKADKIYQLLRDPGELEKAAATFNGLPLLSTHEANRADDHKDNLVVGATGTKARFEAPYLVNDLVIWPQDAIDGVEDESQKEISCGYRYTPDMTPGTYEGAHFDGVMRGIVGNHVALVKEGRAGPDIVVGDSALSVILARDEQERDDDGKFGSGGGGSEPPKKKSKPPDKTSPHEYAVNELRSGKHPTMGVVSVAGSHYLADKDDHLLKGLSFKSRDHAIAARSKIIDKALKTFNRVSNDSTLEEILNMPAKNAVLSRTAVRIQGALSGHLLPKLAADAKLDLTNILAKVTRKSLMAKDGKPKPDAVAMIVKLAKDAVEPLLAPEAKAAGGAGPDDVMMKLIEHAFEAGAAEAPSLDVPAVADPAAVEEPGTADPAAPAGKKSLADVLKARGMSDDDISAIEGEMGGGEEDDDGAMDETDEDKKKREEKEAMDKAAKDANLKVGKTAMDAAIKAAVVAERAASRAVQEARDFVRPWVGDVAMAHDSALAVYTTSLAALGVDTAGVKDPAALRLVLGQVPKPNARAALATGVAMDAASAKSLAERFPHAAKIAIN